MNGNIRLTLRNSCKKKGIIKKPKRRKRSLKASVNHVGAVIRKTNNNTFPNVKTNSKTAEKKRKQNVTKLKSGTYSYGNSQKKKKHTKTNSKSKKRGVFASEKWGTSGWTKEETVCKGTKRLKPPAGE